MEFKEVIQQVYEIKRAYSELNQRRGEHPWGAAEYAQGFVGDVGDLIKMIMVKNNHRSFSDINFKAYQDIDTALAHELTDCLWSIIVIAGELGVDLEAEFTKSMRELRARIESMKAEK